MVANYVEKLEKDYDVEIKYEYHVEQGFNPMLVKMKNNMLNKFIFKYGKSGNFNGVSYKVDGNIVEFRSGKGMNIETMLFNSI